MMIDVILLIEGRQRQRFEGGQARKIFPQHRCPADVIVAVVVEDRRSAELDPGHYDDYQCQPADDLESDPKTSGGRREGERGRGGGEARLVYIGVRSYE